MGLIKKGLKKVSKRFKRSRPSLKWKSVFASSEVEKLRSYVQLLYISKELKQKFFKALENPLFAKKVEEQGARKLIKSKKYANFAFYDLIKVSSILSSLWGLESQHGDITIKSTSVSRDKMGDFFGSVSEFMLDNLEMSKEHMHLFFLFFQTSADEGGENHREKLQKFTEIFQRAVENGLYIDPRISLEVVSNPCAYLFNRIVERKRQAEKEGEIGSLNGIQDLVKDLFLLFEVDLVFFATLEYFSFSLNEFNDLFSSLAEVNSDLVEYLGTRLITENVA